MEINKCSCGGNSVIRSFKQLHFGYFIKCDKCNKEMFGQALQTNDARINSIELLTNMQNNVISKWNNDNSQKIEKGE